ncbi:MAG: hypothetical protein AAF206_00505 [Bacteroidota bacterium]
MYPNFRNKTNWVILYTLFLLWLIPATLMAQSPAGVPGGVDSGMVMWLRSDYGLIESGGGVLAWLDQSGGGWDATQADVSDRPVLSSDSINFHPSVFFDGNNDWMKINAAAGTLSDSCTIFVVVKGESETQHGYYLSTHLGGGNRIKFGHRRNTGQLIYDDDSPDLTGGSYFGRTAMLSFVQDPDTRIDGYFNGTAGTPWTSFSASGADRASLGQEFDGQGNDNQTSNHWHGKMAEIILYDWRLPDSLRQKVETYLAIRYGLSIPSASHAFLDDVQYRFHQTGIGKNAEWELDQEQSRTEETDGILSLLNPSDLQEDEYLILASNGAPADQGSAVGGVPAGLTQRLGRIWKTKVIGTPGSVELRFDMTGLGWNITDPSSWKLLVDTDTDFSDATISLVDAVVDGNELVFSGMSLTEGDLVSLGNKETIKLLAKAFLTGPYTFSGGVMGDQLRQNNYVPVGEPYQAHGKYEHPGGESIGTGLLDITGNDAIVDWVLIEIRDENNPSIILQSRAAVVQRDGDIVSSTDFGLIEIDDLAPGSYYVALRHRNHLGVMTRTPLILNGSGGLIDFSTMDDSETFGNNSQYEVAAGVFALWGGDANVNGQISFQNASNDGIEIFLKVLLGPGNASFARNFVVAGYHDADVNLDGKIVFQGGNSDATDLYLTILLHPLNTTYARNYVIDQRLP